MAISLSSSQKKYLKSIGHSLKPIVNIGKADITDGVIETVTREFELHELIKIKVQKTSSIDIKTAVTKIVEKTDCNVIRVIGFTALLYKQNEEDPVIHF